MMLRALAVLLGLWLLAQSVVWRKKRLLGRVEAAFIAVLAVGAVLVGIFPKMVYLFEPTITEVGAYAFYFGAALIALFVFDLYLLKKVKELEKKLEKIV